MMQKTYLSRNPGGLVVSLWSLTCGVEICPASGVHYLLLKGPSRVPEPLQSSPQHQAIRISVMWLYKLSMFDLNGEPTLTISVFAGKSGLRHFCYYYLIKPEKSMSEFLDAKTS